MLKDCPVKDRVVKLNVAFKPAGMNDGVYYPGKWVPTRSGPDDKLMRISPPYMDSPFFD